MPNITAYRMEVYGVMLNILPEPEPVSKPGTVSALTVGNAKATTAAIAKSKPFDIVFIRIGDILI